MYEQTLRTSIAFVLVVGFTPSLTRGTTLSANEITKLIASDGAPGDLFGHAVAISGDVALVGVIDDDDNGTTSGSAYVFRHNGAAWVQEAKLLPLDGAASDQFGVSVGISGNTAVVGANGDDDDGESSGSAYVFRYDGSSWVQEAKLLASDGATGDNFGRSVSVSGNVAVIGAREEDNAHGSRAGSAYVFVEPVGGWNSMASPINEAAKLTASDGAAVDFLGHAVAISDDVVLVGALHHDDNGSNSGAAYIFVRPGGGWDSIASPINESFKLIASDGAPGDLFGHAVAISGDVALVGVIDDDDNGAVSGSAYVFRHNGPAWVQEAKLLPLDGAASDQFGVSVGISGNTAVVGANGDDDDGESSGSAYVFRYDGSSWVQEAKLLASDGATGDNFGRSVSVSGNVAVIGARHEDNDNGSNAGAAYLFCAPCTEPIPTVSEWGLIVMSLLVLTAGTLVYARRRPIRA